METKNFLAWKTVCEHFRKTTNYVLCGMNCSTLFSIRNNSICFSSILSVYVAFVSYFKCFIFLFAIFLVKCNEQFLSFVERTEDCEPTNSGNDDNEQRSARTKNNQRITTDKKKNRSGIKSFKSIFQLILGNEIIFVLSLSALDF